MRKNSELIFCYSRRLNLELQQAGNTKFYTLNECELNYKKFVKEIFEVETNIVIAHIEGKYNATQLAAALKEKNILVIAMTPALLRFVVHLDITSELLANTLETIEKL